MSAIYFLTLLLASCLISTNEKDLRTRHITSHQNRKLDYPPVIPASLSRLVMPTKRRWTPKFKQNVFSNKIMQRLTDLPLNIKRFVAEKGISWFDHDAGARIADNDSRPGNSKGNNKNSSGAGYSKGSNKDSSGQWNWKGSYF